jgi:uncharacterized alkaline shock family protein YloU
MTDTFTITTDEGEITVAPGVLSQVVIAAAESVDGARARRPKRGVEVDVADGRARVELELAVGYGRVLPEVAAEVQRRVHDALRDICGIDGTVVDVAVEEVDP